MKRNPRKLKWTKSFRKAAGKEMVVDSTLQFAARRHVPLRYDREMHQATLSAMGRITEIRQKRERAFYKRRMRGKRAQDLSEARKLVKAHEHLLPRLRGSEKRKLREEGVTEEEIEKLEEEVKTDKARLEKERDVITKEVVRTGRKNVGTKEKKARIKVTNDGREVVEFGDGDGADAWGGDGDDAEIIAGEDDTMDVDVF
ncbi:hypothetical protein MKZ38_004710 [Zalerion maritima]|uniref:Ribosome biogenesis protein RLP24 n=1 Tax=Zalerion maritima TaxID=339359 RepID=A0AAD5RM18_9PEZI|nr:hypothetical protein MKZ38_004710 [Zalerion maritima]